jgi:chromosome segregation ATPase
MDAIRKKMQSLKAETDGLYATIAKFEGATAESNKVSDQADADIRDYGKKVHGLEIEFDESNDKLTKIFESLEEKEKGYKEVESDVCALSRRIMLMEEEVKKSETGLADVVTKLALSSKEADGILKNVKVFESKCMNNEVTLEELEKNLRSTLKLANDNDQKLDELGRKLGVQEDELKRALDRADIAEKKLKGIEDELASVGDNMKSLEKSAEKDIQREEKLIDKIYNIQMKYKVAEGRFEYGEMNITKLNQKIDNIEDEIYREKLKVKKCSDELGDTFDDMLANY